MRGEYPPHLVVSTVLPSGPGELGPDGLAETSIAQSMEGRLVSLFVPTLSVAVEDRSEASDRPDPRPVLAVVDLEAPLEDVLRRAASAAAALDAPLCVLVLHPRLGFSTDAALVRRFVHRMDVDYRRAVAAATLVADDHGLDGVAVSRVPYARTPLLGSRVQRARRAAAVDQRRVAARLVVAAKHLRRLDGGRVS